MKQLSPEFVARINAVNCMVTSGEDPDVPGAAFYSICDRETGEPYAMCFEVADDVSVHEIEQHLLTVLINDFILA